MHFPGRFGDHQAWGFGACLSWDELDGGVHLRFVTRSGIEKGSGGDFNPSYVPFRAQIAESS